MLKSGLITKNIQLSGFSLIDFAAENNWEFPECDWIFFSSKNAVKFFFAKNNVLGHQKIACVGDGTFKVLSKYVNRVDYVGNAIDTHLIGKEFAGEGQKFDINIYGSKKLTPILPWIN